MLSEETLRDLYCTKKYSMKEMSEQLGTSLSTIEWWMNKHGIERRSRSDANYEKYNKNGNPFEIKQISSKDDAFLYGLGVGLFWGEGNKVSATSLRLGNTDPGLLRMYLTFLRSICGVEEAKIRFGLQIFNDCDPTESKKFWMKELSIKDDQFMQTISIVPQQGKGTYRKKNEHGVVTVYVNNIKLVDWMHIQLKNLNISPSSSVVERIHGKS